MEVFISLILLVYVTLYIYLKYIFSYWTRQGVAQVDPVIPFGNSKNVVLQKTTFGENLQNLYKQLKVPGRKFAGIYFFTKPELLLIDPELVKTILTKDFHYFSDRGIHYNEENDPLTAHLLALEGNKWKTMRQKLTPTFSSGKMKMMFQTLVNCSDGLSDILNVHTNNKEPIDIKEIAGRFTTDVIGSCAFGLECNSISNPDNEFRKWGKRVFEPTRYQWLKRVFSFTFPKLFDLFRLTKVDPGVNNFFMTIIRDTVEYREKNNIKRNDFLQLLINVRNSVDDEEENDNKDVQNTTKLRETKQKALTLEQIAAQSFLFFLAGFETSSTTMSFFFYDLATHLDIQDKVRLEINNMLEKYDNHITYEGVLELHYLDNVINESMRLHSAIPVLPRRCKSSYKIPDSNVIIEKGTTVMISVMALQSDPEYYPDPEKFDPERFSAEEKEKRHAFTFLPFGEGPRNCIGSRFGLMQTKVGIIVLLKNHRFTVNEKTQIPFKMDPRSFIFSVEGGIWLNAERI